MTVQTDIVLGATLDLVAGEATFQDAAGKRHVTVQAPSAGAGKVSVNGGSSPAEVAGFYVVDHEGSKVIAVQKGTGATAADLSKTRIFIDGTYGNAILGGHNADGDLVLRDRDGSARVHLSASVGQGEGNTVPSNVHPTAAIRMNGVGKVEIGGLSNLSMLAGEQCTIDLHGSTGLIEARALALGAGTARIADLLGYVKALEARIAALEASR